MENSLEKWKSHSSCGNCPQGQLQITSCPSANQSLKPAAMHYRHEVKARSSQRANSQVSGETPKLERLEDAPGIRKQ